MMVVFTNWAAPNVSLRIRKSANPAQVAIVDPTVSTGLPLLGLCLDVPFCILEERLSLALQRIGQRGRRRVKLVSVWVEDRAPSRLVVSCLELVF